MISPSRYIDDPVQHVAPVTCGARAASFPSVTSATPPTAGAPPGLEQLFAALYEQLHRSAQNAMGPNRGAHTLQPTALVNEAYIRLMKSPRRAYVDRNHFLLAASRAMRHVLVDHFRRKNSVNRPAGRVDLDMDQLMGSFEERAVNVGALEEALVVLERENPEAAQIVELRFFGGVGMAEISKITGLNERTLHRRWQTVRLWLHARVR